MKTITKRITALVLCLIMLCGTAHITVFALFAGNGLNDGTYSSDPGQYVANIALANEGRTGSNLGYSFEWCAAFVSDCAEKAGQGKVIPPRAYAYEINDALLSNGGYTVSANDAKPGDICIIDWSGNKSSCSHVEIVYAVSGSTIYTIGGNTGSGTSYSTRVVKKHAPLSSSYIVRIIRPAYNGGVTGVPTDVWVSLPEGPESKYCVNSTVDISFGAKYATQFNLYIFKGSESYWYGEFTPNNAQAVCPASFDKTGHYSCYVQAVNSYGYATSGWIGWDIIDSKPSVSKVEIVGSSANSFPKGTSLTFKFTTDDSTEKISWGITKDGSLLEWHYTTEKTLTYKFNEAGSYYIEIDAVNKYGTTRSNKVYFNIVDHTHSYTSKVTKQPTCTEKGVKTFTCSCGNSYTESIAALGHNYKDTVIKPTCTEQGYTIHTCTRSRCSYSYKSDYKSANGHTPGEWKVTKEPTLTSKGTETQYCSVCGKETGTREIPKLTNASVHSVKVNDIDLKYKQKSAINPEITADKGAKYTIKYSSSNTCVKVDDKGNITAAKQGSSKITVTVTDSNGNTVEDSCVVNVRYSGFQWFIIIVLFGWIWYI